MTRSSLLPAHIRQLAVGCSLLAPLAFAACTVGEPLEERDATEGTSIALTAGLTGCRGQASSTIPASGQYRITTFGGPSERQPMSCGGTTSQFTYYAASRQRYGCGAKLKITANGKCIVATALDYGPDVCVERAAGMAIMDVSPQIARALFGASNSEIGWSDRMNVDVEEVARTTPVGPCSDTQPPEPPRPQPPAPPESEDPAPTPPSGGGTCQSDTLGRELASGECVQAASNGVWYQCNNGAWRRPSASRSECTTAFGFCESATLGRAVPPRTCVQSASNDRWYQCNGSTWASPASETSGPLGACASAHPL